MQLSDEVKQFLSIVDREVGLDVFFTACILSCHQYEFETEREVLDRIQEPEYEGCMEDIIDEFIIWVQAEQELALEEHTFLELAATIQTEMD